MIPIDNLRRVTTVIAHENCPDGLAAALIARDALPNCSSVQFVQHNTDTYETLPAVPGMLFVDITPPPIRAADFASVGTVVLDHHKDKREIIASYGENGVFADEALEPGVSGAVLAYRHIWKPLMGEGDIGLGLFVADFARLAGVRDTWVRSDPQWHEAGVQASTLMFFPPGFWLDKTMPEIESSWPSLRWIGDVQARRHEEKVDRVVIGSHRFTTDKGTRVACFEGVHLSSDAAERIGKEADLIVGFGYKIDPDRGAILILSCRSHTGFDCSAFAKAHGGGGHTRAASCAVPVLPDDPNPFAYIRLLLSDYERCPMVEEG